MTVMSCIIFSRRKRLPAATAMRKERGPEPRRERGSRASLGGGRCRNGEGEKPREVRLKPTRDPWHRPLPAPAPRRGPGEQDLEEKLRDALMDKKGTAYSLCDFEGVADLKQRVLTERAFHVS